MALKNSENIESIGIVKISSMGDVVCILPMIASLKSYFQNASITLFVSHAFVDVVRNIGIRIIPIEKYHSLSSYMSLIWFLRKYHFDVLICAQTSLRANLLYPFMSAKRKIGFHSSWSRYFKSFFLDECIYEQGHVVQAYLGFCRYLGIQNPAVNFNLSILKTDQDWIFNFVNQSYIVIHPKASTMIRTWSVQNYVKLIDYISCHTHHAVVLTGSREDVKFVSKIQSLCQKDSDVLINIAGKTTISQLIGTLMGAQLLISPDSGPAHLGSAVQSKVIGLYATFPLSYIGPYGNEKNCIDAYPKAVKKYLKKDVSSVPYKTRVKYDGIMDLITVDEVILKLKNLISSNQKSKV